MTQRDTLGRNALLVLLLLNGGMFVVELVAGWRAQSMGLVADGLDMGADAAVYLLALLAIGASDGRKLGAARFAGRVQLLFAVLAILEAGRRAIMGSSPEAPVMISVAVVALAVNIVCLGVLRRHRDGDVHLQAAWIFSATDVQANLGVLAAGVLVGALGSAIPDLVIGLVVCWLVLRGALRIRARVRAAEAACFAAFLAVVLGACRAEAPGDNGPGAVFAVDTGRVVVEGGSLYWEAAGAGAPIVLIHGGNLDRRMWDAQFDTLRHHYRVLRYDARGYGKSSPADRPFRAPDDLAALLRALQIPRAALIGLSMGGGIAIDFALAYPEMVDRLVLAAPSISGGTWPEDADTLWLDAGRAAFARGDSIGLALAWLESDYIRSALGTPEAQARFREIITDNAGHLMRRARDQDLEREVSPPAADRIAELRMPILLLVGSADTPMLLAMANRLTADAPRVQRIDFPGVGHMINLEAEATFNRAVLEFLARPEPN